MKKVLIIHESLQGGGAEKVLIDILKNFDYSQYDVTLLLYRATGTHMSNIPKQVKVLDCTKYVTSFCRRILRKVSTSSYYNSLKKYIRNILQPDHFNTAVSFMEGITSKLHSFVLDYADRNISWVHTDVLSNYWYKATFRSGEDDVYYCSIDEILFVSKNALNAFEKRYSTQAAKRVIYNLIDREEILHSSQMGEKINKRRFTVVNVGRLEYQKEQHRIITIAEILKKQGVDIDFWIVGKGSKEQELKSMAKEKGVEDRVKFWGFQKNPNRIVATADLFLLTSSSEGFPLVVCEAMCLGKPVISTKVTGPDELLADSIGILCNENEQELASAIKSLYENSLLYAQYAERSTKKSLCFNVANTMSEIYSVL